MNVKTRYLVDLTPGRCTCGCGAQTSRKARFAQGHDQRLKGQLLAAHRADKPVTVIDPKADSKRQSLPALEASRYLSTDKHDWTAALKAAPTEPPRRTRKKPVQPAAVGAEQTQGIQQ